MVQHANKVRQGLTAGLVALAMGGTGCSHTMSEVFDAPEPPPMEQEAPPAPPVAIAPPPAPSAPMPMPAPSAAQAALAPQAERSLREFLNGWRNAWAGRDIAAYLQHYHPDFKGQAASPEQWRAARQRIIGRAGEIELQLGQAEIRLEGSDRAWLTFAQRYRTKALSDEGIKQLQLRRTDGRWLIEQETFTPNRRK